MNSQPSAFDWGFGIAAGIIGAGSCILTAAMFVGWIDKKLSSKLPDTTSKNIVLIKGTITHKMADDIQKQIQKYITDDVKSIDLVIHTFGGSIGPTLRIIHFLKSFKGAVKIFIPYKAFSGGSLIALAMMPNAWIMGPLATVSTCDPGIDHHHLEDVSTAMKKATKITHDLVTHDVQLNQYLDELKHIFDSHVRPHVKTATAFDKIVESFLMTRRIHDAAMITQSDLLELEIPIDVKTKIPQSIYDLCDDDK